MLDRVITGGQTGADQAGWRAARRCGIATGGYMPRRFLTEDATGKGLESHPEFANLYGAMEHPSSSFRDRRRANLALSDAAIVFNVGPTLSPGTRGLLGDRYAVRRPVWLAYLNPDGSLWPGGGVEEFAALISSPGVKVLDVAGNRESSAPGIGAAVERHMVEIFLLLGHHDIKESSR